MRKLVSLDRALGVALPTTLTERLYTPVLVNAETGSLTDSRELPWYVTALLISQPLHFGDYGGMPLKILRAAFDVIASIVLGSWVKPVGRASACGGLQADYTQRD